MIPCILYSEWSFSASTFQGVSNEIRGLEGQLTSFCARASSVDDSYEFSELDELLQTCPVCLMIDNGLVDHEDEEWPVDVLAFEGNPPIRC
jgi:hypothetical protein